MTRKQNDSAKKRLVVLLHAYSHQAQDLDSIKRTISREWPQAIFYTPDMPASIFSMHDPNRIALTILQGIDRLVKQAETSADEIDEIIFVGHSLGSLLARKVYIAACGELESAPLEPVYHELESCGSWDVSQARPWAARVSRIILLAGMNRGWRVSHHLGLWNGLSWWLGSLLGNVINLFGSLFKWMDRFTLFKGCDGHRLLIFSIRRGAEFITQLRIQWILLRQRSRQSAKKFPGAALTIQLLGSQDDMVAPEDNVDLVSGGDFIYLDVPYSGHSNIIQFDDAEHGDARRQVFLSALLETADELEAKAVIPSDEKFQQPDYSVKRMVFVIHGIRDAGFWTHKIARRIKTRAVLSAPEWATETSSYGYFPMLPFLLAGHRRIKVEWLMDQYAEALARYPDARISYVGHSNGTYLLAKALELYPCCHFDHVVFAGSVVNRHYHWERYLNASPRRVNAVLNLVSSKDWVVAFFPKIFQFLGFPGLGSAGHDGFSLTRPQASLFQVKYIQGAHSAGVEEPVWDMISDFVIDGSLPRIKQEVVVKKRNPLVKYLGWFPPLVWGFLICVLVGTGYAGALAIETIFNGLPLKQEFWKGLMLPVYVAMMLLIVTRL